MTKMKSKNILLVLAAAAAVVASGCTAAQQVGDDVSQKFDQGITGQGRLISSSPTTDSFGPEYQ
jgi:predicted small secreted protein